MFGDYVLTWSRQLNANGKLKTQEREMRSGDEVYRKTERDRTANAERRRDGDDNNVKKYAAKSKGIVVVKVLQEQRKNKKRNTPDNTI